MYTSLLTLAVAVTIAAPVPKVFKELYFPTTVGDERVVVEKFASGWSKESAETVTKVVAEDGSLKVTLKLPSRSVGDKNERVFDVADDGVFMSGPSTTRPSGGLVLKIGAKPGESWEIDYRGGDGKQGTRKYTFIKEEEIEVPAGKYKALRVDTVWGSGRDLINESQWYARRVGLVKQVTTTISGESSIVLQSFTPAKDETKKDK